MRRILAVCCVLLVIGGCSHIDTVPISENELDTLIKTARQQPVKELSREIAIFNTVAFGLGLPLRNYLNDEQTVKDRTVLDLGAGSGVLSLIALKNGASNCVATDINPYAVANAQYNAQQFGFATKLDARLVFMDKPGAYSVIGDNEKFDLIVSNPPQYDEEPKTLYDHSYANPELAFLKSILEGLKDHLKTGGKGVFTLYDNGLEVARHIAKERGLKVNVLLKTSNRNGIYYLVEITG